MARLKKNPVFSAIFHEFTGKIALREVGVTG